MIPLQETDISISEEHLSFTLRDDCFVDVDVSYVFFNPSDKKKNITMGFEAEASSGAAYSAQRVPGVAEYTVPG